MVGKIKETLTNNKKIATGGASLIAILGLIWTIYINPLNADIKDLDKGVHFNKEKNIEQDGVIKMQGVLLQRIDDNVKILLNKTQ